MSAPISHKPPKVAATGSHVDWDWMKGGLSLADPAPSKSMTGRLSSVQANDESTPGPQQVGDGVLSSTEPSAAGKPTDDGMSERFANTKLNIALINDPKNGPRFTMTKREAGLEGGGDTDDKASPEPKADIAAGTENSVPSNCEEPAAKPTATMADEKNGGSDGRPAFTAPAAALLPAHAVRPSGTPPPAGAPGKIPIDSAKTFVGLNGTYYDESWRWMDWRGTRQSWNWPAALSFGHWFAYRRLYGCAAIHLLWFAMLTTAVVNNFPVVALTPPVLALVCLTGIYGNTLYFRSFRRAVDRITEHGEGSYDQRRCQLAAAGGTNPIAVGIMAALSIGSVICVLYVTFWLRGTLRLNFWPFF